MPKPLEVSHRNSMGLVRYYLAFAVVVAHFNVVFGTDLWWPTDSYNAVGGFFALSGFLIYPSYLKSRSTRDYLLRRARRILPPYVFIVLLCAFSLVAVSTLPAREYFFNIQWVRYLVSNLTFLNFLGPELPGVFQNLPVKAVDGSLWTMKIEVLLYLSVPLAAACLQFVHKRVRWFGPLGMCAVIYLLSAAYRWIFTDLYLTTGKEIYTILSRQFFGQLMYFYGGVAVYFIYDKFKVYRHYVFVGCMLVVLLSDFMPHYFYRICVSPVIATCIVLYFSTFNIASVFNRNNISYDIYLYHFPVILVVATYAGNMGLPVWMLMAVSVAGTVALGAVSWFGIGKRFLRR